VLLFFAAGCFAGNSLQRKTAAKNKIAAKPFLRGFPQKIRKANR
jgi:hypothetical protein